jgi:hypothetical protein
LDGGLIERGLIASLSITGQAFLAGALSLAAAEWSATICRETSRTLF